MNENNRPLFSGRGQAKRHSPQNVAVICIAVIAVVVFIDWAQALLVPFVTGILLSYALDPIVIFLRRYGIPRPLGAAVTLGLFLTFIVFGFLSLKDEAVELVEEIPAFIEQLETSQARAKSDGKFLESLSVAASEVNNALGQKDSAGAAKQGAGEAALVKQPVNLTAYLADGFSALLVVITQWFSTLLLVYFLLAIGALYKRKLVRLAGPSFRERRKTVLLFSEFNRQIRRFVFVMLVGAVFVAVLTWGSFSLLGVERAGAWGAIAGLASVVPYLGPFLVFIGTAIAGYLQFETIEMAFIIAMVSLLVTSIQGFLLTPWLAGKVSSVNTVVIFIGLLFWGWLWGPIGVFLATPIMMLIKAFCDHFSRFSVLGYLLGK